MNFLFKCGDPRSERRVLFEKRIVLERVERGFAACFYEFRIAKRFHGDVGQPGLRFAEELAGTAKFEVFLGKFKTILCFKDRPQAGLRFFALQCRS